MKKYLLLSMLIIANYVSFSKNFKNSTGFIENKGQIAEKNGKLHPEVGYKLQEANVNAYFKADGIIYHFHKSEEKKKSEYTEKDRENFKKGDFNAISKKIYFFRMDFSLIGADKNATHTATIEQEEKFNYYLGHCPGGILDVKSFEEILYKNVYPNIDVKYYYKEGKLKYEFIVHPGGNIEQIKFLYDGATKVSIENKKLRIENSYNTLLEEEPYTYYLESGSEIKSSFQLNENVVSFGVGNYDASKTIVIDPTVTWASYYSNGTSSDFHANSAFDSNGNIFTAFATYYNTWPTINAGSGQYYDGTLDGSLDLVIAKINANYSKQWTTFYGGDGSEVLCGTGGDYGKTLGIDANDNVYVGGSSSSGTVFPTMTSGVSGAFYQDQTKLYGGDTPFLIKLNNNGVRQWATLFQHEQANTNSAGMRINGIFVRGTKVYFTGETYRFNSNNIPLRTLAGAYNNSTFLGDQDPFLGRFTDNCILEWSTYLNSGIAGQKAYKQGSDLTMDPSGNLIYAGQATGGFGASPTSAYLLNPGGGAYYSGTFSGTADVQITKFNTSMQPVWSTYYGSSELDRISEVSTDLNGNILMACRTIGGTGLPTANPGGAFYYSTKQTPGTWGSGSSSDGGIAKFTPAGALYWATYVGGTNADWANITGISSDNAGNIYAIGYTNTTNFPTLNLAGSYNQAANAGGMDMVAMKFGPTGSLTWSTYYGGSATDYCYGVKINASSVSNGCGYKQFNAFGTSSTNLPTTNPGGSAFYESSIATTNSNGVLLITEASSSGNSTASTGITTSAASICSGSTATLTVAGGALGSGASWQWYTGSCGGTPAGTGTSINVSPTSGTTYYVRAEGTCNTTACSNVAITVNAPSVAPASINAIASTLCSGGSTTLTVSGGSLGTAATWEWYSGSCGGTSVGSGASIVVSPGATTTYYVRAQGTCGNTTCASIVINVNSNSAAPTAINTTTSTICSGNNTTLSVSGGSLGSGASWQWFTGSCGGTSAGTGTSISVSPASATTYYVYATGTCNTTSCASVLINVNANSTAPASINTTTNTICSGGNTTLSVNGGSLGTAANWQWYSGSCGGTSVGSGASIVVSPGAATTYYVRAEGACGNTACVSTVINVNTNSAAPTSINTTTTTICSGNNTTLSVNGGSLGSGANWQWFTGSCNGTSAGTGSSISVSPGSATTYYVNAVGSCNTTACANVLINVNSNSTAAASINTTTNTICSGGNTTLSVNGGSLGTAANWQWYSGSCGGTSVGSGASIVVSPGAATTYYVRAEGACGNTACVSTVINVNTNSAAPSGITASTATTICSGSNTTLNVTGGSLGSGASWQWFTGSCTGTPTGTGSSINVSPTSATTYYVKAVGSCNTTACENILINVNSVSTAPSSANASAATICSGTSSTLTVSGGALGTGATWNWYANGCGTTPVGTGATISVSPAITTAYFVRAEGLCGNSICAQVTVSVTTTPSATWLSPGTICTGSGILNLSALVTGNTGGTWSGTGVTGTSFNPAALAGQTIPVTYSVVNGSCTDAITHSISVASSVSANWNSPGGLCASGGTVNLSSYLTGSTGGTWTGSGVSGTTFDPLPLSGPIAITYSVGSGSCADSKTYTINVTPAASATWASPGTLCASNGTVNLNAYLSGTAGGTWTGTGVSGNVFDPSTLAGQTVLVNYQVGNVPCVASVSHTIQVVNIGNATFTLPTTLCENATPLDLTTLVTGNAGGVFTGTGVTTNTFNPSGLAGQSIVITYTVGVAPCGATQSKTITVTSAPLTPSVAVSNATICAGSTTMISASGSGGGAIYTVYSSPNGTGAIGVTPAVLSPSATTTYYLQSVSGGCSNIGGDVPFTITVNANPVANAGADQNVCLGSSVTLTASGGGTYVWSNGITTSTNVVSPVSSTSYTVVVTNANACVAQDVVNVAVVTATSLQANNDNTNTQANQSVTTNVSANDTGDPNTVTIISGPLHGSATVGSNGTIIYTPSDNYVGVDTVYYSICDVSCGLICKNAKLIIEVTKEIVIVVPGGFSPNGDGLNDKFEIIGLENFPDNNLIIFNRWGDEIFKAAPYKNDWNGQSEGKGLTLYGTELVEGTYFYILTLDKTSKPYKGYVELKRK